MCKCRQEARQGLQLCERFHDAAVATGLFEPPLRQELIGFLEAVTGGLLCV